MSASGPNPEIAVQIAAERSSEDSPDNDSSVETVGFLDGYLEDADEDARFQITNSQYLADRSAETVGTANPSIMDRAYWKYMIKNTLRGGYSPAHQARRLFDPSGEIHPPWQMRDPVWYFDRMGQTVTELPDGRIIFVGGEHEDGYDPDFCIYNGKLI